MYQQDQKLIAAYARESAANTAEVVKFVLATIKTPFYKIDDIYGQQDWRMCVPASRKGIEWLQDAANQVYVYNACHSPGLTHAERLVMLLAVPGLGLPKAGFVLQLTIGATGCLDTHNIRNFGLDARDFATSGRSQKLCLERARLYVDTCERLGGCEYLWDQWCTFIANKYASKFTSADEVSRLHAAQFAA